jgi:hypothetical protein
MNPLLSYVQIEKEQLCNTSLPVNLIIISLVNSVTIRNI